MERDTALKQLQDMRQEILTIYTEMDMCKELQGKLEALKNEKENPAPPVVKLKPENTGDKLEKQFIQQNRERISNSRKPEIIAKSLHVVFQLLVCGLLVLDVFFKKGIIIHDAQLEKLSEFGGGEVGIVIGQLVLAVIAFLIPFNLDKVAEALLFFVMSVFSIFFFLYAIVLPIVVALFAVFFTAVSLADAWIYPVSIAVGLVLTFVSIGIIKLVRKIKVKFPKLTAKQKAKWRAACLEDEKAVVENRQAKEAAQRQWEANRAKRLPEIDREIQESIQEFNTRQLRVDEHMIILEEMDALCEDDKNLQMVDMLIRFIETRRADSIKEALQEYDKLMNNQKLLEIEKQKLEVEIKRVAQEHADRMQKLDAEKKHQAEMEYLARDSARSRADAAKQLRNIGDMIYYDLRA